ncbi:hypothetical protein M9458_022989, partial [Cirrhinus mrigala]
ELLFPSEDVMAVVFRGAGGGLHAALHQPVRQQPSGSVLRGVSHAVVHGGAGAVHPAGRVRGPLGDALHPLQHRLVPAAQDHASGQVPGAGGDCGDGNHGGAGLPQPVHAPEHQRADLGAVQRLRRARILAALRLHQQPQHDPTRGRHPRQTRRPRRLQCPLAARAGARLQDRHYHLHIRHE